MYMIETLQINQSQITCSKCQEFMNTQAYTDALVS